MATAPCPPVCDEYRADADPSESQSRTDRPKGPVIVPPLPTRPRLLHARRVTGHSEGVRNITAGRTAHGQQYAHSSLGRHTSRKNSVATARLARYSPYESVLWALNDCGSPGTYRLAQMAPWECRQKAQAIQDQRDLYRLHTTRADGFLYNWVYYRVAAMLDSTRGDTAQARQHNAQADAWRDSTSKATRFARETKRELDAASRLYKDGGCWNDGINLLPAVFYGGGIGSHLVRECEYENWEISFDGGATWTGFWAETCVVQMMA